MKGLNTILIVIVILLIASFGAYWYIENQNAKIQDDSGLQVKLGGDTDSQN